MTNIIVLKTTLQMLAGVDIEINHRDFVSFQEKKRFNSTSRLFIDKLTVAKRAQLTANRKNSCKLKKQLCQFHNSAKQ